MEESKKNEMVAELTEMFVKGGMSVNDAEDKAKLNVELEEKLLAGTVKFRFLKKDGSVRVAVGTLKPELIEYTPESSGTERKKQNGCLCYWDIEKGMFRSFCRTNLIDIVC